MLRKLLKLYALPILWLAYFLSGFFKRDKNLLLFGENKGTVKEVTRFLATKLNSSCHVKVFWVIERGHNVTLLNELCIPYVYKGTFKYFWLSLRAGKYIYSHYASDIGYWLSSGAVKINVWHGHPLKCIEADYQDSRIYRKGTIWYLFHRIYSPYRLNQSQYVVSMYSGYDSILRSAFRIRSDRIIKVKSIRDEVSKDNSLYLSDEEVEFIIGYRESIKKNVLYLPTFRQDETHFSCVVEETVNSLVSCDEYNVFYKLHPNSKEIKVDGAVEIPSYLDPQLLFENCFCLITDYSSLMLDYLALQDRGLLCIHDFDIDMYILNERKFYFDWDEVKELQDITFSNLSEGVLSGKYPVKRELGFLGYKHNGSLVDEILRIELD